LKEFDRARSYAIHQTVFPRHSPRPAAGVLVTQGLRLADALERVPHGCLHQVKYPQRKRAIRLDPEAQIVEKSGVK